MSAKGYLLKRIGHAFAVIFAVVTVVFAAVRAIPGDPARLLLGGDASAEALRQVRMELGLDQPIYVQYIRWLTDIMQGDLGESIFLPQTVSEILINAAAPTLSIAVIAISLATFIAIPLGIFSATHQYELEDQIATVIAFFGLSMPGFWIAILLIVLVATRFEIIPSYGYVPIRESPVEWLTHLILPSIAAGIPPAASIMRMTRSSMLEVLGQDYIQLARAKGLNPHLVVYKHALQNALIPVVTLFGILTASLLGGVVAVEIVFGFNGFGNLIIDSILRQDFPVVQGIVIVIACLFVFMNLFVDLIYTVINPRIGYDK